MLSLIQKPEIMIGIIIIVLLIFSKFVVKLDYLSVFDIIRNHLSCFKGDASGKLKLLPVLNYCAVPLLLGLSAAFVKEVDGDMINIITIIITIIATMLFTLLATVIDMKAKINADPNYYRMEGQISKQALIETYYTIMFEILVSVILLILCFINKLTESFLFIQSFLIYGLLFLLIVNLLMILKRIFRVIDTDIRK